MITAALREYLVNNLSLTSIYVENAPLDSGACVVIDDNGDGRDRHWENGATVTGTKDQEYEITVWADLTEGGPKYADNIANELAALLDNFSGTMTDSSSPTVSYRVLHIEVQKGGGGFDQTAARYANSVFVTLMYT